MLRSDVMQCVKTTSIFNMPAKSGKGMSRNEKPKNVSKGNVESMSKGSDDGSSVESDQCGE